VGARGTRSFFRSTLQSGSIPAASTNLQYENSTVRKYGYRPDKQERATQSALEQAEVLSEAWAAA
jgi:hypothetical protein